MALFKNMFSKNKSDMMVKKTSQSVMNNYEQEPAQAALIVNDSIEKGDFSDISQKLEELPSTGFYRTQYVFEGPKMIIYGLIIAVCICFVLVYLYFAAMGIGMHVFSDNYEAYSLAFIGVTLAVCIINIILVTHSAKFISFVKRYKKYYELMKYKNIEIIDDICAYTAIPFSKVVKDLSMAIKLKYIPQGHFTTENLVFIASDMLFKKYEENKPVYDRYYKKIIEERIRMGERSEEIQKILDIGQEYIDKIHDSNRLIKDKDISIKLDRMEKFVSTIFREVDLNPDQSGKLGMFLNYYLPTMEKLLMAYIDINEKKVEGQSLQKAKKDIDHAIDILLVSFESILNQFYEELELDISSDVSAMEALSEQERM